MLIYDMHKNHHIQRLHKILKRRITIMSETVEGTTEHVTIDTQIGSFVDMASKLANHYGVSNTNLLTDDFEAFCEAFHKLTMAIYNQDQWSALAKIDHLSKVHDTLNDGLSSVKNNLRHLMKGINRLTESEDKLDRFEDTLFELMEDHMDSVVRDNAREDMREIAQEEIDDAIGQLYVTR